MEVNPRLKKLWECSANFEGRKLVIWGTRAAGAEAKQLLEQLGFSCGFFVSSRPRSDQCCGVLLRPPENLDRSMHYIILTTGSVAVWDWLKDRGFVESRNFTCFWKTGWHDDLEYEGCSVGKGCYSYESLYRFHPMNCMIRKIGR